MSHHLADVVRSLGHPRILVVGDLIHDRYIWGQVQRISPEAPVPVLHESHCERRLGGAANVAHMLRGLEAEVAVLGVVGDDPAGEELRHDLEQQHVDCTLVATDPTRPTTVKQRFMGSPQYRHPHQMLRVDRESREPLDARLTARLTEQLRPRMGQFAAILISDYAKGVCIPELLAAIIAQARQAGIPVVVDPGSGVDYDRYRGATAITPNRLEASQAAGLSIARPEDALVAGRRLCDRLQLDCAYVTIDRDGIAVVLREGKAEVFPTRQRDVCDITGAGDMVLAVIGLGTAAGIAPDDLARLANIAGGLEVERVGVVAIRREEILADLLPGHRGPGGKLLPLNQLVAEVERRRQRGETIVLTNGCFDLLHAGHVTYLEQAAHLGDCLIVAVNSDHSIRQLGKGPDRPLIPQEQRALMLSALEAVDYVTIFDEPTPHRVVQALRPHILVKGGTYRVEEIVAREVVEAYGGTVQALGAVPGVSTTEIIRRIRQEATGSAPLVARERKAG